MKVVQTVPILTEFLMRDHSSGATSLGLDAVLYDDPVAKVLSEIGDPATQSVAKLFDNGDTPSRRRAAIVLSNIGTAQARKALRRQIQKEPDQGLRAVKQTKG